MIVLVTTEKEMQDLTALEVEVKGTCEPFSVLLQPYAIYIPGTVLVNTPVKRQFRVSLNLQNFELHIYYNNKKFYCCSYDVVIRYRWVVWSDKYGFSLTIS